MKIKKIAKQLKEHDRLGRLIRDLDMVLKDFDKTEELPPVNQITTTSILMYSADVPGKAKPVDITIHSGITELVRDEIKEILLRHRVDLKKKQDKLEV